MAKAMTPEQRRFWAAVQLLARATRRGKTVDLEAAADALALEQEIQTRLDDDARPALLVAEPAAKTGGGNGS